MTNEEKARGKIEQRLAVLNPSDEKLRETITEKDAEIARLKLDAERYRKLKLIARNVRDDVISDDCDFC